MITDAPEVKQEVIDKFPLAVYGSRIFVIESEMRDRTSGGLYIPKTQQEVIVTDGIVVAVGASVTFCQPGDRVYYARFSGARCSIGDDEFRVMNEEDLMGKWRKEDAVS